MIRSCSSNNSNNSNMMMMMERMRNCSVVVRSGAGSSTGTGSRRRRNSSRQMVTAVDVVVASRQSKNHPVHRMCVLNPQHRLQQPHLKPRHNYHQYHQYYHQQQKVSLYQQHELLQQRQRCVFISIFHNTTTATATTNNNNASWPILCQTPPFLHQRYWKISSSSSHRTSTSSSASNRTTATTTTTRTTRPPPPTTTTTNTVAAFSTSSISSASTVSSTIDSNSNTINSNSNSNSSNSSMTTPPPPPPPLPIPPTPPIPPHQWSRHGFATAMAAVIATTGITGFIVGWTMGQQQQQQQQQQLDQNNHHHPNNRRLPNGLPRTCCDTDKNTNNNDNNNNKTTTSTTNSSSRSNESSLPPPVTVEQLQEQIQQLELQHQFIVRLQRITGKDNVISLNDPNDATTTMTAAPYLKGARIVHSTEPTTTHNDHPSTSGSTSTTQQQQQQQQLTNGRRRRGTIVIVTPRQLHHVVNIVEACLEYNNHHNNRCTIVPQGQNTGLTGGSTPRSYHYYDTTSNTDDDNNISSTTTTTTSTTSKTDGNNNMMTVVLSFKHLNSLFPLDDGQRVCCMAGVGLTSLEQFLQEYFPDRESHSQLGSSFLNPTTAAGIAFGSGGTQCSRKGPAYTERALYLKVSETNKWQEQRVEIVNTLQIEGFDDADLPPDTIGHRRKQMDTIPYRIDTWGRWIQQGYERDMKYTSTLPPQPPVSVDKQVTRPGKEPALVTAETGSSSSSPPLASDIHYAQRLCRHDSNSVSRYNADCSGPDCCRSEGKVIILATVHDTFMKPKSTKTYWISFDSIETALLFRKLVALDNPMDLPISMEYLDRDAFDVINDAGRVMGNVIKYIGTSSSFIRHLWNMKLYIEALPYDTAQLWVDQILFRLNPYFPPILPPSIMDLGLEKDHHVILTIGDFDNGNMDRMIHRMDQFAKLHGSGKIHIHECDDGSKSSLSSLLLPLQRPPAAALNAFRFVAAPAFRTWCVGHDVQGYSVDYALPKNGGTIPPLFRKNIAATSRNSIGNISDNNNTRVKTTSTLTGDGDDIIKANERQQHPLPIKRMRYSHFACNVVHEDLAYDLNVDIEHAKHLLKDVIEYEFNGKLPAEHGHGTEYTAPQTTQERWKRMDPLNIFNPGIGGLSHKYRYKDK